MSEFHVDEVASPEVQSQPHNRQAEEAVLGSVLIDQEAYFNVAQFLKQDDFYIVRNRWIWDVFTRLHERRSPIDYLTVCQELEQSNQLTEMGGPAYIMSLINQTPSSLNAEAYGRLVEESSVRRRLLSAANEMAKLAYDQQKTLDTIMDEAEKSVFGISERRVRRDLQPIQQVLSEVYDRVDQLSKRDEEIFGVPTGLIDLDKLFGGLQKSDLLIVAGRPGVGKTGFMLSVMKNAAQRYKKHVAMFSLEMSNEQLVQRLIAQETGIDTQRLRTGKLTEEEIPLFTHAIEVLGDTHIFLDDTPAITPMQLRTKCRRLHLEYELDLVLVDYLQLMSGDLRTDNRVQEVSYISRSLKVLARELNVPVLAGAQLSRAVEQRADKRPVLSDLRESGCLAAETLVCLADGSEVPIADLAGRQPTVLALNADGNLVPALARKVWRTGRRPVYRLLTQSGQTIRATGNHPFLMAAGWQRLDHLKVGDQIAVVQPVCARGLQPSSTSGSVPGTLASLQVAEREALSALTTCWDTLIEIAYAGEEDVYDIEVPILHNFVANEIVVHNSLEQDADIVMFIHRPEALEKDSPKQNIAEIIVGKHRNGPTHPGIELVFLNNLARFENAAPPPARR